MKRRTFPKRFRVRLLPVLAAVWLLPAWADAQPSTRPAGDIKANEKAKMEVAAIYFPSWHEDDHYSAWFGEGWNEWKLVNDAKPRFEGHNLLKPAPEWNNFDEADPQQMARQIDLATEYGVDVFVFDWYWYSGVKFLHRALEDGFLHAPNRHKMKFALMWADHTWGNYFPFPYTEPFDVLLPIRHSAKDFTRVMQYGIDHYFNQPTYWRVGGGLYFSIFAPEDFVKQLGGPEKARAVLDAAREQGA